MFKLIVIFFICLVNIDAYGLFTYDRVAHLMQKGEFDKAKPLLQKMVVNSPENPEILYDAGVASYKTKDFKQAAAYFKQAAHMPNATPALKEKAYFNSANTAVALKDFESAKDDYENVLKMNPDNERAKHNLVMVEVMEEREEEKDETKKEDKENEEQDKDRDQKNQDDSEKNKKEKEESEQDKQSKDEQQGKDQQKNKQEQGQDEKNNDQQKNDDSGTKDDEQKKQEQEKTAAQKVLKEDKEGKEQLVEPVQEQAQEDVMKKMAPHLVKILDEQEKKDAALHKMMVKQAVGNNMAGHNGQNNW